MDDDLEDEDDLDDDVGTMGDGKIDTKPHRKPAMRISTNNPVMVQIYKLYRYILKKSYIWAIQQTHIQL